MFARSTIRTTLLAALAVCGTVDAESGEGSNSFDVAIAPLLSRRCLDCHNPTDKKGGLDLSQKAAALAGGESGAAVVAGRPDESLLWQRVANDEMPPKSPLPADEKKILRQWIAAGAKWETDPIDRFRISTSKRAGYDWWSLRPVRRPGIPPVANSAWPRNPIDAFVLSKLEQQGLGPSPAADKRTLIRRLSFDLIGLPPTPLEVERFLADASPSAYDKLVDRLLTSPHHGERWARHWLDVVRFGESQGFERDKLRPNAWRYRDWVTTAFNDDMPYDEFSRRQIAGDVLEPGDPAAAIATGFLVAGPWDEVGQSQQSAAMRAVVRQDELEDLVSVVGQTFLGLTIHCARCHDHKFDPVRQEEYYRLTAALAGVHHGERNVEQPAIAAGSADRAAAIQAQVDRLKQKAPRLAAPIGERVLYEIDRLEDLRKRALAMTSYAVAPKPPEPVHLLVRGNPAQQGPPVTAGGVAAVGGTRADFGLSVDSSDAERRIALARWIVDRGNPLFARVIVNRLWHYHFGVGLVETPSDFGFNGGRPTHPLLIDYLADEFVRSGWSLKAMQRLVVTSATYRQASLPRADAASRDADNRLLWRKSPVRLEAEVLRDTILAVAGKLNCSIGGPGYEDFKTVTNNTQFYEPFDPAGHSFNRRALYRTWVRSGRNRFLDAFDCPDPSTKTPRRRVTTTPLQALSLLNNSFVLRMADRLAERLQREAAGDAQRQVNLACMLAWGRSPSEQELHISTQFVEQHGLPAFCRVLFNSNEFLHID